MESIPLTICDNCRNRSTLLDERAIEEDEDKKESKNIIPKYFCIACKTSKDIKPGESVYKKIYYKSETESKVNPFLNFYKNNPTCMRMVGVNCPNPDCKSHNTTEKSVEVSFFYDISKEQSVFICQTCSYTWIL